MRKLLFIAGLIGISCYSAAAAQSVQQGGNVSPGHVAVWSTNGVIQDGGTSASSPVTSFGITSSSSSSNCINSAAITGAYVAMCMGTNPTSGTAVLSVTPYTSATALPLEIDVNGINILTLTTGGLLTYPSIPSSAPTTHCALWDNLGIVNITTCP